MFEGLNSRNFLLTVRVGLATGAIALAGCGGHGRRNYSETEQFGADTFADYQHAAEVGPYLEKGEQVKVDCVATGPVAAAPTAKGKWYHMVAPEQYKGLFVAANTFENGPLSKDLAIDPSVPNC